MKNQNNPGPDRCSENLCSIGWLVAAVPDEEELGYWGYTSVPKEGCDWWYQLPTR